MADIAAEVGLTRPAMHYYFRTKERLFQAIFGDILMSFLPAEWFSWRIFLLDWSDMPNS
jgi:AcrR family transcriptional regulator